MSNYPKALEKFLEGEGAPYKGVIDELFATDAGKRILEGVGDNLDYIRIVDNKDELLKNKVGDCRDYDDCEKGKYGVRLNMDYIEGDPLYLGFILQHEMEHIHHYNAMGGRKSGYPKSGELFIEPDSDSRAFSSCLQSKQNKKYPDSYQKILKGLGNRGYNVKELEGLERLPDNMIEIESYEVFKYNFVKKSHNFFRSDEDMSPRMMEHVLEKYPDFKGRSNKDFFVGVLQKDSHFKVAKREKAEEAIFRDDINKNPNLIGNDKDNYPVALRALLGRSDMPEGHREKFNEFSKTETGKKIIEGIQSLDSIVVKDSDKIDGSGKIEDGVASVEISSLLLKKSPELFVEILAHELNHIIQKEKSPNEPVRNSGSYGKACDAVREADCDFKPFNELINMGMKKDSDGYKYIEEYLLKKGASQEAIDNLDYQKIKKDYANNSDAGVKKIQNSSNLIDMVGGSQEKYDEIMSWQDDAYETLNDSKVLEYEQKIGASENSSSKPRLNEKEVELKKLENNSRRIVLDRFKNREKDEDRIYNQLLEVQKQGRGGYE